MDIVGHSLGGALAQWVAAAYTRLGNSIGRVVTFNSPGISASYARLFKAKLAMGVTDYITSGDIVSMAGQAYIYGQYFLASFNSETDLELPLLSGIAQWELAKHTSRVLTAADGGTLPADVQIDPNPHPTSDLNSRVFVYSDPEYSDMLSTFRTALYALKPFGLLYLNIPTALTARWRTEANRSQIINVLFGQVTF